MLFQKWKSWQMATPISRRSHWRRKLSSCFEFIRNFIQKLALLCVFYSGNSNFLALCSAQLQIFAISYCSRSSCFSWDWDLCAPWYRSDIEYLQLRFGPKITGWEMARKKIREYDSKRLLKEHFKRLSGRELPIRSVQVSSGKFWCVYIWFFRWIILIKEPDVGENVW